MTYEEMLKTIKRIKRSIEIARERVGKTDGDEIWQKDANDALAYAEKALERFSLEV